MNSIIELKKQVVKQKINFKEFCTQNSLKFDDSEITLIFEPESSDLLKRFCSFPKKEVYTNRKNIDYSYFENFLDTHSLFYLVFPSIFNYNGFYKTNYPIILANKESILKFIDVFKKNMSELSSLALFNEEGNGVLLDGFADFPCEENGLYDGYVNDLFIIRNKLTSAIGGGDALPG